MNIWIRVKVYEVGLCVLCGEISEIKMMEKNSLQNDSRSLIVYLFKRF